MGPDSQQGQLLHTEALGLVMNMVAGEGAWHNDSLTWCWWNSSLLGIAGRSYYLVVYSGADGIFFSFSLHSCPCYTEKKLPQNPQPNSMCPSFLSVPLLFLLALPVPTFFISHFLYQVHRMTTQIVPPNARNQGLGINETRDYFRCSWHTVHYVDQTSMPVKKNMDTTVQTKIFAHIIYKNPPTQK